MRISMFVLHWFQSPIGTNKTTQVAAKGFNTGVFQSPIGTNKTQNSNVSS